MPIFKYIWKEGEYMNKPSYYAVIPAEVRYDNELSADEKLMYGELTCLTSAYGYC